MNSEEWQRVQSVFAQVADLPRERQQSVAEVLCSEEPHLLGSVLDLLQEDAGQQPLLDSDVGLAIGRIAGEALHSDHLHSLVQKQIGSYRLLRVLGEGGMGIVYLAERSEIGGLVAIKLLRDAWLSPMRRERFALEQQMLVKLNHPAIARLYDANTMDDGTPWFVMEYADGQPLVEYLRARQGSLRADLTLFRQVCEAVQYAHAHAIIHRDLKPSNILVTADGEVKLLDFGIAKQMQPEAAGQRTVEGLRLLTPGYAAPEQYSGGDVGVFTDIYSLGVLMYEILTGSLPDPSIARTGRLPQKPSSVTRNTGPHANISKHEWADLDVLCLTALQPEPERRYRSVDAMQRDLLAFLDGRVLEARPSSVTHSLGKFVNRNRLALASVTAAVLLLVATAIVFTVRLARARNAALAEVARTNRVQRFTESLFDGGNPEEGPALNLSAASLLQRGEIEAESLHDDPRMQADMLSTVGGAYQRLGQLQRADTLLQKALQERKKFGEQDAQYVESLVAMGLLRKDQGRMQEAEDLLREANRLDGQIVNGVGGIPGRPLWALGSVFDLRGKYTEAATVLQRAITLDARSGKDSAQLADDLAQLADTYFYLDNYQQAEALNQRALRMDRAVFGDDHPVVAQLLNSLGQIAQNEGHFQQAEVYFRRGLAIDERWYGDENQNVAVDFASLARVMTSSGRYDQAKDLLNRALNIEQRTYGHDHSRVAITLNDLGDLAMTRDQDKEAENDYRDALAIWIKVYGEHHAFVGLGYANLASVYMFRKDYPAAEQAARKALAIDVATLPPGHVNVAIARVKLGRILLHERRYVEAEPETMQAYRYFSSHESDSPTYLAGSKKDLIEIETHLNKPELVAQVAAGK